MAKADPTTVNLEPIVLDEGEGAMIIIVRSVVDQETGEAEDVLSRAVSRQNDSDTASLAVMIMALADQWKVLFKNTRELVEQDNPEDLEAFDQLTKAIADIGMAPMGAKAYADFSERKQITDEQG